MAFLGSQESCDKLLQVELTHWSLKVRKCQEDYWSVTWQGLGRGVFSDILMVVNKELDLPTTRTPKEK